VKLPGTETWDDGRVQAALAFARHLPASTSAVEGLLTERGLRGGRSGRWQSRITDIIYQQGAAAGLAFATERLPEGLALAGALLEAPLKAGFKLTMMQRIFGATLGAIVGTVGVRLVEEGHAIAFQSGERIPLVDLALQPRAERQRLADLIVPAAFASARLSERQTIDGFVLRFRLSLPDRLARRLPFNVVVRTWEAGGDIFDFLMIERLMAYEEHIATLRSDQQTWNALAIRRPLLDWPLLAMLVGIYRTSDGPIDGPVIVGEATAFLHDLAKKIAKANPS
jgi:hypothetical protein